MSRKGLLQGTKYLSKRAISDAFDIHRVREEGPGEGEDVDDTLQSPEMEGETVSCKGLNQRQ